MTACATDPMEHHPDDIDIGGTYGQAAVAGNYSGLVFRPSVGAILIIEQLVFAGGAAFAAYNMRLGSDKSIQSYSPGLTVGGQRALLSIAPLSAEETVSSTGSGIVSNGNFYGKTLFDVIVPVNDTLTLTLKRPITLRGDDPGSLPGLQVWNVTAVNLSANVMLVGRQRPLTAMPR